jgi:hypothetical protein
METNDLETTELSEEDKLYQATASYFEKNNYLILKNFIDPNTAGLIYQYCLVKAQRTDFMTVYAKDAYRPEWDGRFGDEQAPISYNCYADPFMDTILGASTKTIGKYVGFDLIPTYSYWRLYQHGEVLKRHRDRHSCEISATLCLGYNVSNLDPSEQENYDWPMWVETDDDVDGVPINLKPGDLILYKGCIVDHWREKFLGLNHAQVFLHYNDANGPYKIALDGRPILGIPKGYQDSKNY